LFGIITTAVLTVHPNDNKLTYQSFLIYSRGLVRIAVVDHNSCRLSLYLCLPDSTSLRSTTANDHLAPLGFDFATASCPGVTDRLSGASGAGGHLPDPSCPAPKPSPNSTFPPHFLGHCFSPIPASGSFASSDFPVPCQKHGVPPIKQPLALEAAAGASRKWARKKENQNVLPIC
jgi:hypothetical protein